jgi:two-component system, sporulation sensor kinase B
MLSIIKPLIVNITILFSLTFNANLFFPFRERVTLSLRQQMVYGFFSSFAAVLCMFYPIETLGETNFDFRMIVILLVTLYVGGIAGALCTAIVSVVRLLIGGPFAWIGVLVSVAPYMIAILFRPFYKKAKNKWVYSIVIVLVYFLFYFFVIMNTILFLHWHFYIVYFFIFFITYLSLNFIIERLVASNKRLDEMIYVDKLAMIGDIAASFAHEIRNPVTTVRGFIQFLEKDTNDVRFKQFAPLILDELDRTNKIITDYLKLAKPTDFHLQKIDLDEVLYDCINLLRPFGSFANVSLEFVSEEKHYVWGDEHYLKQAFINIIKNGIEAIEGSGVVKITKQLETDRKTVKVIVEDNGKGMTEEQLRKIGLPYYTTKSKGTGLGSMISNRLIREMGGTIHYSSRLNRGTTVEITLPIYRK